jgi:hypothetical protein
MNRISRLGRGLVSAVVIALLALGAASPVMACVGGRLYAEGGSIPPPVLFTGTAIRREEPFSLVQSSFDMIAWTFAVDDVREGPPTDRIVVRSPRMEVSCGVEFELGQRYVVAASSGGSGGLEAWGGEMDPIDPGANPPRIEGSFVDYLTWTTALVFGPVLLVVVAFALDEASGRRRPPSPREAGDGRG